MDTWAQVVHLSKRAGFGDSLNTLKVWQNQGYANAVNSLFTTASDLTAIVAPLGLESKETRGPDFLKIREAWVNRMVQTNHPLVEKMTLFWHNHFATAEYKVNSPALMLLQNNTLRRNALGSFRQMLLDVTADPAMLIWLDNARSTKKAPNENYGRELMELFTIGLNYTQADVTAASQAMTGYELNRKTGQVKFVPARHNDQVKTFFGHTGDLGPADIIDDLLAHPNCAPFIVTKVLKWFVHPNPPVDWVTKFAQVFVQSGYEIGTLMRTIFRSEEFLSPQAVGILVKSPADYVIGLIRMTGANVPARQLDLVMTSGGLQLFNPPNVAGWAGGQSWLSSATLLSRFNFAFQVAKRLAAKPLPGEASPASAQPNPLQVLSDAQLLNPSAITSKTLLDYVAHHGHLGRDQLEQQLRYLAWIAPEFQLC